MIDTKVINFIGGPGCGKSTTAANLFAYMKQRDVNCELVAEYAKGATWRDAPLILKDQLYVFAKQHNAQFRLRGKVQYMITDSPLILSLHYGEHESEEFRKLVRVKWNEFNNINFYIKRTKTYNPIGRNQNEQEADEIAKDIKNILDTERIDYTEIESNSDIKIIYDVIAKNNLSSGHAYYTPEMARRL
jgi:ABC-type dipeptide/oligopeptide/nickel transport system ATPase component